jgi:electron transport complex protein RnfG
MLKLYLRLGVPTILICAIAAAGLAGTYAVTVDRIAAQKVVEQDKALSAALPEAKSFKLVMGKDPATGREAADAGVVAAVAKSAGETPVLGIFQALDASGQPTGWGLITTPRGYGGPMEVVVGLDRNGKVAGVKIGFNKETPGLGTKAIGAAGAPPTKYLLSFGGVDSADKAGKLDGVTVATKSSRGVKRGVQAALNAYDAALKGLEGGVSK